jgi:hypothetical protein
MNMNDIFKKLGFYLTILAVMWMIIPCPGHCELIVSKTPVTHNCCDSSANSNDSSNKSNPAKAGLMDICISTADSYTVPSGYHYVFIKTSIENLTVTLVDNVQYSNKITNTFYNLKFDTPPKISIQLLIANLNTPHAPPVLS